jgi:hypothetical protein
VLLLLIGVYLCLCRKICASYLIYGEPGKQSNESRPAKQYELDIKAKAPGVTRQKDGDAESFLTGKQSSVT